MGFSVGISPCYPDLQDVAPKHRFLTKNRYYLALLIAFQLLMIAVIQPYGNFPLNDDWAYAHSAIWFNTEHRIRLSNWIAMNLLPQTVAGGLVTAAVGFSFDALRHLTQIVALLASIAAFYFFRSTSLAAAQAFVATLVLIAMPSWPILANSFMTDLYCLVFALSAAALFVMLLEKFSKKMLALAILFSVIGVLQRQVVIVIPFAFMATWFWTKRVRTPRDIAFVLAPFVIVLAAEILYQIYLKNGPGIPDAQLNAHSRIWPLFMSELRGETGRRGFVGSNILSIAGYLGLFLIGWMVWWGMPGSSRRVRITGILFAIIAAGVALVCNWLPPYRPNNTLDAAGIGPYTLYDVMTHATYELDRSPGIIWPVAGIAAAFGLVSLCTLALTTLAHFFREKRKADSCRLFLTILVCSYLVPFVITDYFDRYLLFVLPFLIALWARTWPISDRNTVYLPRIISLVWICLVIGIGAAATHDYFAWNRARWDAIRYAESIGVTVDKLDGGFEYNGFYGFETRGRDVIAGKSWWWIKDDKYIVAFSLVPGYEVVATFAVRAWLPRTPTHIKLLRQQHLLPD